MMHNEFDHVLPPLLPPKFGSFILQMPIHQELQRAAETS